MSDAPAFREERERVVDLLSDHFAGDALSLEEFERRVDRAHRARTPEELAEVVRDLPPGPAPARSPAPSDREPALADGGPRDPPGAGPARAPSAADARPAANPSHSPTPARPAEPTRAPPSAPAPRRWRALPAGAARERDLVAAFHEGAGRRGAWDAARRILVYNVVGSAELDFREAGLAPGITEVTVVSMLGGVRIVVPSDLPMDCRGLGVLGVFESGPQGAPLPTDPSAPGLRIRGVSLLSDVRISPGDDA